jgi:hypothetical protein
VAFCPWHLNIIAPSMCTPGNCNGSALLRDPCPDSHDGARHRHKSAGSVSSTHTSLSRPRGGAAAVAGHYASLALCDDYEVFAAYPPTASKPRNV